jgi:hypothetical protein
VINCNIFLVLTKKARADCDKAIAELLAVYLKGYAEDEKNKGN